MKLLKYSHLLFTCSLLWADVKGSPEDERAIREFLVPSTGSTEDKKEREIRRLESLSEQRVVENVDFLNIYGGWVQGRQTYADRMNSPQARAAFDGRTRDAIVESIRFLRPDVVVAIVRFYNHKQDGKPTGEETRASFVLTKENGRWKLNAFHNTTIQYGKGGNPARP